MFINPIDTLHNQSLVLWFLIFHNGVRWRENGMNVIDSFLLNKNNFCYQKVIRWIHCMLSNTKCLDCIMPVHNCFPCSFSLSIMECLYVVTTNRSQLYIYLLGRQDFRQRKRNYVFETYEDFRVILGGDYTYTGDIPTDQFCNVLLKYNFDVSQCLTHIILRCVYYFPS